MNGKTGMTLAEKLESADRSIGAILVESGRLKQRDADRIVQFQKDEDVRFGEAGIHLGLLTPADLLHALSLQFDYPYLNNTTSRPLSEEIVVAYRPFSPEGERLRALRSQLQLRWYADANRRTSALCIVGAGRGAGRSYLAANLAVTFAQLGERTLLIDGDMRAPRQHQLFKLDNQVGLSGLLARRNQEQVIHFVPGIHGLAVLPAGPMPPNPSELLSRPTFGHVLDQALGSFDVVLIDTPALDSGADSTLLSRFAGTALAVARTGLTQIDNFRDMVDHMSDAGVNVIGSVLVDVPPAKASKAAAGA